MLSNENELNKPKDQKKSQNNEENEKDEESG